MSARYRAALVPSPGSPRNSSASARCAVPANQTPARSPGQKLTPLNRPAVTARLRTSQPTDAAYLGSRSARYDQLLTSSGTSVSFEIAPLLAVPTSKRPACASHIAATKRLAHAALADQAGSPVSLASRLKRAYRSMLCSVDFHSIFWPFAVSPPV